MEFSVKPGLVWQRALSLYKVGSLVLSSSQLQVAFENQNDWEKRIYTENPYKYKIIWSFANIFQPWLLGWDSDKCLKTAIPKDHIFIKKYTFNQFYRLNRKIVNLTKMCNVIQDENKSFKPFRKV